VNGVTFKQPKLKYNSCFIEGHIGRQKQNGVKC